MDLNKKKILLIDDNLEYANSTIKTIEENEKLEGKYVFLKEKGINLGCSIVKPNETEPFIERCDQAFELVQSKIKTFDILMIDGFLLGSGVEKENQLISLNVVDRIFSTLELPQNKIYIITGYNTKIGVITYSNIYSKYKDKLVLLVRATDDSRKKNRPDACIFRDENGSKCNKWSKTCYSNPLFKDKCTYEECLIETFLKAEGGNP